MRLTNSELSVTLNALYGADREDEHVVAWNVHHEEQIGDSRQGFYEAELRGAVNFNDWNASHSAYVKKHVNVDRNGVAHTFDGSSVLAQFPELEENQWLIRIERLSRAFGSASLLTDFASLGVALEHSDRGDPIAQTAIERFLAEWNQLRDGRPQFAAFKDEVAEDLESLDWPNRMRDRLGLGHLIPGAAGAIEIAVFVYSVRECTRRRRSLGPICTSAFSRPTVTDADLNVFFFPIPTGANYGATLHLAEGRAGELTQEVLHLSFDYKRSHLKKIGRITGPHHLGCTLSDARNTHLAALQARGHGTSWTPHPKRP